MKKIFILIASLSLFLSALVAQEASVTYVKGKVEVQRGSEWVPLNVGDTLSKSDVVNTGFQSEAKIKLMDNIMYLGPVTRITLEDLSSSSSQDKVNVYLSTGSVRSKVNHTENKRVNYTVHTPVAVASVRGTDWGITSNNDVFCKDGGVAVASKKSLTANNQSSSDMEESVELPEGGTVVQQNQTLTVSDSVLPPPPPQNSTVSSANAILASVGPAALKDAVRGGGNPPPDFGAPFQKNQRTANVSVQITFSED